ncbi:MAG: histidinol-phosphatase HisJ [Cellulosilyticaceae bacterium]
MERYDVSRDGHIHTPFCPHGTQDALRAYVERAKEVGIQVMTFTEHMPLPEGVLEKKIAAYCSPSEAVMLDYFKAVAALKKEYAGEMVIATGLEVDYIEGYEEETKQMLGLYGPYLQDGLLSVHIVKVGTRYICFDEISGFRALLKEVGSLEALYDLYFETLIKSIKADLGPYKPRRIGHMSLVRVFQKEFPFIYENKVRLEEVVRAIKEADMAVEFNTGGLRKSLCQEQYPSGILEELVVKYDIPVVWGSDAHQAKDVGFGFTAQSGI